MDYIWVLEPEIYITNSSESDSEDMSGARLFSEYDVVVLVNHLEHHIARLPISRQTVEVEKQLGVFTNMINVFNQELINKKTNLNIKKFSS